MDDIPRPDTMPGHPGTLTLADAAAQAGVHERTLRRWIKQGRLVAAKIDGQYRIALPDLDAAMRASARAPDTDPDTRPDTHRTSGHPGMSVSGPAPAVDLQPLADLIDRQGREVAQLREAAAVWQVRALQAEERLARLTATVGAEDQSAGVAVTDQDDSGGEPAAQPAGLWDRLRRWWGS